MRNFQPVKLIILTIAAILLNAECFASSQNQTLRIGLVHNFRSVKQVSISATSTLQIINTATSQTLLTCPSDSTAQFEAANNAVIIRSSDGKTTNCSNMVKITSQDIYNPITVESSGKQAKQYRGSIEISVKSGLLCIINVVQLEYYLMGTVPSEMPCSYPAEALKAQAIAARTFALKNIGRHSSDGYDLCDSDHCQAYGGVLAEDSRTNQAIKDTAGMVLTYNGQLASAMYSADCGGVTQSYADVYQNDKYPYLCSVTDPADIHKNTWNKTYTLDELSSALCRANIKEAQGLTNISISKEGKSGRVLMLNITGTAGNKNIYAETLRRTLGYDNIKSTLFTINASSDGKITFSGKGYGHGIGLCQTGAKGLANPPYNYTYTDILAHYFPGTQISSGTVQNTKTDKPQTKTAKIAAINIPKKKSRTRKEEIQIKSAQTLFEIRVKAPDILR